VRKPPPDYSYSDDAYPRRPSPKGRRGDEPAGKGKGGRTTTVPIGRKEKKEYRPPTWEFPKEVEEPFDVNEVVNKLGAQFRLSALRDAI
jgi:hypothetical protein